MYITEFKKLKTIKVVLTRRTLVVPKAFGLQSKNYTFVSFEFSSHKFIEQNIFVMFLYDFCTCWVSKESFQF